MQPSPLVPFSLTRRVSEHPYQTLLVAAGVGYLLGGGLFTRLTLNALRLGARVAAIPIVRAELLGVAAAAFAPRPIDQSPNSPTDDHPSEGSAR